MNRSLINEAKWINYYAMMCGPDLCENAAFFLGTKHLEMVGDEHCMAQQMYAEQIEFCMEIEMTRAVQAYIDIRNTDPCVFI